MMDPFASSLHSRREALWFTLRHRLMARVSSLLLAAL
jgi:hypothetical protein